MIRHLALRKDGLTIYAALFCSVKLGKEILQIVGGFQDFSGAFFIQLTQTSQMQQGGIPAGASSFRKTGLPVSGQTDRQKRDRPAIFA